MSDQIDGLSWDSQLLADLTTSINGQTNLSPGNEPVVVTDGADDWIKEKREKHLWTERKRRKKLRTMFATLQDLLPQRPPETDKLKIIDETLKHIKTLETTLKELETQKQEKLHGATTTTKQGHDHILSNSNNNVTMISANNSSPSSSSLLPQGFPPIFQPCITKNVIMNVCGLDAQFCVFGPKNSRLNLTAVVYVLEKHKLEVISASVWSDNCKSMYTIQTHACRGREVLMDVIPVEEVYKQAAREIQTVFDRMLGNQETNVLIAPSFAAN